MKKILSILVIICMCVANAYANGLSSDRKIIRFTERVKEASNIFNNQPLPMKIKRVSSNEGRIILSFDEEFPDTVLVALNAAKKIWEAKIPTKQPIYIKVLFEEFEPDIAMAADVIMHEGGELQGCPTALGSQLLNSTYSDEESPDGYIIFNSLLDWNCGFTADDNSGYNLPTMAMRGIARCLGFGSSILEEAKDYFSFYFSWPSYFDKLIYNNSVCLASLEQGSREMAEFVKSDNVFVKATEGQYQLHAPKQYVPYSSLCYFKDENSLMSHSLGRGSVLLDIDNKTLDVLRTIGWNLPSEGLEISCNNISESGIGSSYEDHTFSLSKGSVNPSNLKWRFLLKNQHEEYVLVSAGSGEEFTISKIASPGNYHVNVNGDLEGRIECDYMLNGSTYSAVPFSLSLELKPIIHSIENITITNVSRYEFSLRFNVVYTGTDRITVEVEEDSSTSLRDYTFAEPYIAHVKTGRITNLAYSWVTIIASNKYGKAYETLEYSPVYKSFRKISGASVNGHTSIESENECMVQILDLNGRQIYTGPSSDLKNQTFQKGIYIKNETYKNGETKTSKIIL